MLPLKDWIVFERALSKLGKLSSLFIVIFQLLKTGRKLLMKDDISRLRETHRLLQESEARYRELVEGTIDLIAHTDENGNYNFVNHMAEKILGFSPKECIGKSAFKFVHPDDKGWTQHWFNECAEQKIKQSSIENRLVHTKTGKVFNLAWSVTFHYDNSGSILGVGWIAYRCCRNPFC